MLTAAPEDPKRETRGTGDPTSSTNSPRGWEELGARVGPAKSKIDVEIAGGPQFEKANRGDACAARRSPPAQKLVDSSSGDARADHPGDLKALRPPRRVRC